MEPMAFTREILEALTAPFPDDEIEFLPRAQSNGKALGLAYIDARSVMRRLDAVVGPANWSYDFDVLSPDGKMVRGKLTVLGVTKCDAGEAAQEDEPLKSAVSDALKRAAVHFGIGRYLYYLPRVWAPYDAQKRRFIEQPKLDPAAVRHALQICGVSPAANGGSGGHSRPAAAPRPQPAAQEAENSERKSIWTAGAAQPRGETPVAREGRPAPESSGDRAVNGAAAAGPAPATPAAPVAGAPAMVCSTVDCGKPLTKGQHDVSLRAFGQPLCPACQKAQARSAA